MLFHANRLFLFLFLFFLRESSFPKARGCASASFRLDPPWDSRWISGPSQTGRSEGSLHLHGLGATGRGELGSEAASTMDFLSDRVVLEERTVSPPSD